MPNHVRIAQVETNQLQSEEKRRLLQTGAETGRPHVSDTGAQAPPTFNVSLSPDE